VYLKLGAQNAHGAGKPVATALLNLPAVAADKTLARSAKKALGVKA
jgi:hypothetical protein